MEIIDSNAGILTNFEVYELLCECREVQKIQKRSGTARPRGLATLIYETLKYFEQTSPCVEYKIETVEDFVKATKAYKLTKAETVQILNSRPANAVEVQLIIEECEERLSEQQVEDLLNTINHLLPARKENSSVNAEQQETNDQEMT